MFMFEVDCSTENKSFDFDNSTISTKQGKSK